MAFRNGGGVKKSVKWIYDGKEVEVVASYEYRCIFLLNYHGEKSNYHVFLQIEHYFIKNCIWYIL